MNPIYLLTFTLVCISIPSCNTEEAILLNNQKVFYTTQFPESMGEPPTFSIGTATSENPLSSTFYNHTPSANIARKNAENEMRISQIWSGQNNYDWTKAYAQMFFTETQTVSPESKLLYSVYGGGISGEKRNIMKKMVLSFDWKGYPIDGPGDPLYCRNSSDKNSLKTGYNDLTSLG